MRQDTKHHQAKISKAILDLEASKQTTPSSHTYLCQLEEESWPWKDPEHRLPTTHVHHDYCITALFQRSTHKERQRQKSAHTHTLTGIYTHTRGERERDTQREREESHRPPGRAEQHDLPTDCPPAVCCKQSSPSPRIPKSCPPHLLLLLLIPSSHCSLFLLELLLLQLLRLLDVFSPLPKKLQNLSFCVETLLQMRCNGRATRGRATKRPRRAPFASERPSVRGELPLQATDRTSEASSLCERAREGGAKRREARTAICCLPVKLTRAGGRQGHLQLS
jgi:hypothetical protein